MGSPHLDSPPLTPPAYALAAFPVAFASRKPRSYWYRTTFLALFVLVILSVYVLLVAQPSLTPIPVFDAEGRKGSRLSPDAFRLATLRHSYSNSMKSSPAGDAKAGRPQLTLNQTEELAAVSGFLASLPQNVIPSSVDPSQPIDPQLVLDFDTRSENAGEEVQRVVNEVWARNPVMLYSKFYSPISREIKQMLSDLYLRPAPTIIEVDQRSDESVLAPLLFRLTSRNELPILIIGGRPLGGTIEELRYLRKKGEFQRMITAAGGEVYGSRKKPKKL
ncbi:uncharacterized protein LAESUDRAFT_643614 [Laetiporus sulphureus 93-53]|uniref:Uncharacterized protein n=1 Tax=Laetiporus sulphureus 93-53 TaxID=1314785 RepID=A0A165GTM0_9APHY|nr:uncharacterized protein LAESUDRAFT_643614 [Laetiporus sulphureus 93-53]KZT10796.1 hypothetical protein LAESUDRAFT_643614 [Laetiporus sulphureus 93-53]